MESVERVESQQFYYKNIFLLGSLLSFGNVTEYFIAHTEKLIVFYFLPRWDKRKNFIRLYERGKLIKESYLFSPKNIFIQYPIFYCQFAKSFFTYFKKGEPFFVFTYHPVLFFTKGLINHFRSYDVVFWIVDYFPKPNLFLGIYQGLISFFHKQSKYTFYLTDRINRVMNHGDIRNTTFHKTVMWGVRKPRWYKKTLPKNNILFYHGIMRDEHGIELLFDLLENDNRVKLKLLGKCDDLLYSKYTKLIANKNISSRIYFPNRYFSTTELEKESHDCLAAVALYKISKDNFTFYADPGKVKMYAQFGLPIIVTSGLEIGEYIAKFKAGEVIKRDHISLSNAIYKIKGNYSSYIDGLKKFNDYFDIDVYYKKMFKFLEYTS